MINMIPKEQTLIEYQKTIGHKFRQARERKGYSREDISDMSGVSQSYYHKIEAGRAMPAVYIAAVIAKVLDMDMNALVDCIETPSERTERLWSGYEGHTEIDGKVKDLDWRTKRRILQDLKRW